MLLPGFFWMGPDVRWGWVLLSSLTLVRNRHALLALPDLTMAVCRVLLQFVDVTLDSLGIIHLLAAFISHVIVTVNILIVVCKGRPIVARVNPLLLRKRGSCCCTRHQSCHARVTSKTVHVTVVHRNIAWEVLCRCVLYHTVGVQVHWPTVLQGVSIWFLYIRMRWPGIYELRIRVKIAFIDDLKSIRVWHERTLLTAILQLVIITTALIFSSWQQRNSSRVMKVNWWSASIAVGPRRFHAHGVISDFFLK